MGKLNTMLRVDGRRMFKQPLFYILVAIAFVMPVLILTMVTGFSDGSQAGMAFTNTWQMIGALPTSSGSGMGMDMTSMMNINMLYFMVAVLVSSFVAGDFRSGFAKNLFTVHPGKTGYVMSKLMVCSFASALLFVAFLAGTILGGSLAGLSFAMVGFSAFHVLMSMVAKLLLIPMFVALFLISAAIAKSRLWLSLCLSLSMGMLLFMIVPMMTGLTATLIHVMMCLAGGVLFGLGFAQTGSLILKKADLV